MGRQWIQHRRDRIWAPHGRIQPAWQPGHDGGPDRLGVTRHESVSGGEAAGGGSRGSWGPRWPVISTMATCRAVASRLDSGGVAGAAGRPRGWVGGGGSSLLSVSTLSLLGAPPVFRQRGKLRPPKRRHSILSSPSAKSRKEADGW